MSYIEVEKSDIALANRLAHEVLGRTLDELPPQTRNLLGLIQTMVLGHAELSTTQIYTQVAIRKLQQVHALTHPGATRRLRGEQMGLDVPEPQPEAIDAAEALLEALAREADEDDGGRQ